MSLLLRFFVLLIVVVSCQCTALQTGFTVMPPSLFELKEEKISSSIQLTEDIAIPAEEPGYTLLLPQDTVKGMLVLFHSGRDTTHIGYEMRLYTAANRHQLATLYITTGNPLEFMFDTSTYEQLDRYIGTVLEKHPIPSNHLLFAGMSLAGTRALKYAHWCQQGNSKYNIHPRAVVLCDAPLDFIRFWEEGNFAIRHNTNATSSNEAKWVNTQLEKHLGGTPLENEDSYRTYSPYIKGMDIDDRLEQLKGVAVRAYTEPDIQWWLENRQKDYYGINAIDAAAFIRDLRLIGHTEAELITTTGKGYHPDGRRHPHSWSIVDNDALVKWFLNLP